MWYVEKWEWYSLDNRLLWVFRELEKAGKISYIEMRRLDFAKNVKNHPEGLHETAEVVDEDVKELMLHRPRVVNDADVCNDLKLLSKVLSRMQLMKGEGQGQNGNVTSVAESLALETDFNANAVVSSLDGKRETGASKREEEELDDNSNKKESVGLKEEGPVVFGNGSSKQDPSSDAKQGKWRKGSIGLEKSSKRLEFTALCMDMPVKKEADDTEEHQVLDDAVYLRRFRSSSVCSSVSDGHAVDDWGRKGSNRDDGMESNEQPSDEEWIEIESIQEADSESNTNSNAILDHIDACNNSKSNGEDSNGTLKEEDQNATRTVEAWLDDRKKFCEISKNSNFHEYVADNITIKKPSPSLSQSLLSLDSAFCSASALSMSSMLKEQRQISPFSGIFGYGYFDTYNKEYLSKLKTQQRASKRRLKPYNCANRRRMRARQEENGSFEDSRQRDRGIWRSSSEKFYFMEEKVTKVYVRHDRNVRRYRSFSSSAADVCDYSHYTEKQYSKRRYSESKYEHRDITRGSSSLSGDTLGRRRSDSSLSSRCDSSCTPRRKCRSNATGHTSGNPPVTNDSMYEIWQRRREEYMKSRYNLPLVPHKGNKSFALTGYTCGLCFKSFKTRTRREQHSDELMHWACITCGRFFASHTALGQHVDEAGHRKD